MTRVTSPLGPVASADDARLLVLDLVAQVPAGAATTYGDLASIATDLGAVGLTARGVGRIMARAGGAVPWWRVVAHDGRPPAHLEAVALAALEADACPLRGDRVDLRRARWRP
jgi:alkylated DNA nucleotide flippase Atl1